MKNPASHQVDVGAKLTDHKRHLAYLTIHNACSMQITAEISQKVGRLSRSLKEEITCNKARKQKCNYRTKQSIHAWGFYKPRARHNCNANRVN